MKYYKVEMKTIFEDTDYTLAFAFADEIADELVQNEIRAEFNVYMCEFRTTNEKVTPTVALIRWSPNLRKKLNILFVFQYR